MVVIREVPIYFLDSSNRYVQLLRTSRGDIVLKWGCPLSVRTGLQNRYEARMWHRLKDKPNAASYLCPVLDASKDGSWILMPYIQPVLKEDLSYAEANRLADWIEDQGMLSDVTYQNVGKLGACDKSDGLDNGQLVVLDYGYTGDFEITEDRAHCDTCTYCLRDYDRGDTHDDILVGLYDIDESLAGFY